jgi:hypothetical protein
LRPYSVGASLTGNFHGTAGACRFATKSSPPLKTPQSGVIHADDAKWREFIRDYAECENHPGIYILGCFARRVTLYSQQVRALNLIYGLHAIGELKAGEPVVVIGAGAAGPRVEGILPFGTLGKAGNCGFMMLCWVRL